jgi:hypothetical protein
MNGLLRVPAALYLGMTARMKIHLSALDFFIIGMIPIKHTHNYV